MQWGESLLGDETAMERLPSQAAYCETVEAIIAIGWIDASTIEVQVAAVRRSANSTRPHVAIRAGIVQSTAIHVAGPDEVERPNLSLGPFVINHRVRWMYL